MPAALPDLNDALKWLVRTTFWEKLERTSLCPWRLFRRELIQGFSVPVSKAREDIYGMATRTAASYRADDF